MALYSTVPPFQNPEIPTDMPSGAKQKKQDTGVANKSLLETFTDTLFFSLSIAILLLERVESFGKYRRENKSLLP
jgi:hypothetical protein